MSDNWDDVLRHEPAMTTDPALRAQQPDEHPEYNRGWADGYARATEYMNEALAAAAEAAPLHHEIGTDPECEWCQRFLAATSREDGYTVDESADIVYDKVRDPATGKWKPHMVKGTDAAATSREEG